MISFCCAQMDLTNMVEDYEIKTIVVRSSDDIESRSPVDLLISANENGGKDNICGCS